MSNRIDDLFPSGEEIVRSQSQGTDVIVKPETIRDNGIYFNGKIYWGDWMIQYIDYEVYFFEEVTGELWVYDWCSCEFLGKAAAI
jgi:hypothetical protein